MDLPGAPEFLVERVRALAADRPRVLVGLAGPPGVGKSTLAAALVPALTAAGLPATGVPMDGYHLADVALDALGRRDRKGAPDTFDADGYRALLHRLRSETDRTVWAPAFERVLEQPLAGAVPVPPGTRVVVTEGNYLLLPDDPWPEVRAALDEVWSLRLDEQVRTARLVARHVQFGKDPAAAQAWVTAVDEPNARRVVAAQDRADLVVEL
ncbi:nucleoside/nucleotide kinase family protein [Klenkia brasiliensis]|nr:nucleoside/nucleotide kinase family protein [Klenkia brasiliensis]